MPENTKNLVGESKVDNVDRSITPMPRAYLIRSDGAILIPPEVMALLRWQPGDERWLTVDLKSARLVIDEHKPIIKNISPPKGVS